MLTPLEILLDPVSLIVLAIYGVLMIWEAVFPARQLPKVKFWKLRGLSAFAFFFYLSSYLPLFIDPLLEPYRLLDLTNLTTLIGGLVGVFLYEFGVYVWHYALHKSDFLWRTFHQMHHSAERLDTYGAFYFSPLDMIGWTVLGSICFALLVGLSPQAITVTLLVTNFLGMFQHANIKTPTWLGYIIQRPESHTVHHAKGIHKHNYSDLPIFDILFGTFHNPKNYEHQTGFFYGASARVWDMLTFKDLNRVRKKVKGQKTLTLLLMVSLMVGCGKDENPVVFPEPNQEIPEESPTGPVPEPEEQPEILDPVLDSVTPLSGEMGTVVALAGSNFGSEVEDVAVFFNDKSAEIVTFTEDLLEVEVPPRAHTGEIKLVIGETTISAGIFNYEYVTLVSTFAGSEQGATDGTLEQAKFEHPFDMVMGPEGNLYVSDTDNHRIRKISPYGIVTTLAGGAQGYADGIGEDAQFDHPMGLAIDKSGNLFVADNWNHKIRKILPNGAVETVAGDGSGFEDGPIYKASFKFPKDIALGEFGEIYVSDTGNNRIRKIAYGFVETIAGSSLGYANGPGSDAKFNGPSAIINYDSNTMLVADTNNHVIRSVSLTGGTATFAGNASPGYSDGLANDAQFLFPGNMTLDSKGNIYVSDTYNQKIRKISTIGEVTTVAGSFLGFLDGISDEAKFNAPLGIISNPDGDVLYISDSDNNRIRKIEFNQ